MNQKQYNHLISYSCATLICRVCSSSWKAVLFELKQSSLPHCGRIFWSDKKTSIELASAEAASVFTISRSGTSVVQPVYRAGNIICFSMLFWLELAVCNQSESLKPFQQFWCFWGPRAAKAMWGLPRSWGAKPEQNRRGEPSAPPPPPTGSGSGPSRAAPAPSRTSDLPARTPKAPDNKQPTGQTQCELWRVERRSRRNHVNGWVFVCNVNVYIYNYRHI